jgi:hypothetical protein
MSEPTPEKGRRDVVAAVAVGLVVLLGVLGVVLASTFGGSDEDGSAAESSETEASATTPAVGESSGVDAFVAVRSRDNPIVPAGSVPTVLVRLELQPGSYQVFGKVGLGNRDPSNPFRVQCALIPSSTDGTPQPPGEAGSDWGFLHLAPSGSPGEEGQVAFSVTQELTQPGAVVLSCEGYANEHGAFANYGVIRAIEVDSVTTVEPLP